MSSVLAVLVSNLVEGPKMIFPNLHGKACRHWLASAAQLTAAIGPASYHHQEGRGAGARKTQGEGWVHRGTTPPQCDSDNSAWVGAPEHTFLQKKKKKGGLLNRTLGACSEGKSQATRKTSQLLRIPEFPGPTSSH